MFGHLYLVPQFKPCVAIGEVRFIFSLFIDGATLNLLNSYYISIGAVSSSCNSFLEYGTQSNLNLMI